MSHSDGNAGRSARNQYQKKKAAKLAHNNKLFGPKIGKIFNFLIPDSNGISAWKKGAVGEEAVGEFLDNFARENGFRVLHDRGIPNGRGNIDHVLISNRGVFVVDAKNYKGKVLIRDIGLFLNSKEVLYVGNRNQTKLVDGVKKQVSLVAEALESLNSEVPVLGILAFFDAEFPILFKPKKIDGILINGKGIADAVFSQDAVKNLDIDLVSAFLKEKFPAK